ncbi:16053_t:CDS:2 [Cetraspora pellucida]|uniref:16053_t:CDS:1 n=1 Tax=Cetraspora pellucida TaxID=1433469 RepID=A0ACA9LJP2_9GLOM|nr:16053_t:CDS:2 [Cetraspora pellucida]
MNKEQTELDDYSEETFQDDINDISDINAADSFDQVSESLSSNISRVSNLKKRKSSVWPYFNLEIVKNFEKPVCRKCGTVYKNTTGVSTLRRHLKNQQIEAPKKKQTTLHIYQSDLHNEQEQKKRNEKLIFWLIVNQQSFTMVENQYFHEFINILDPHYVVPTRQAAKNMIMDEFYKRHEKVKNYIKFPFTIKHMSIDISEAISCVLKEFELSNKTIALTTDNELAMITCSYLLAKELENEFDNIGFSYYRCAAHVLNLVAKQELRIVDSAFKEIRYLKAELDMEVSVDNNSIAELYSNNDDQQKLQNLMILLEPLEKATKHLSAASYPTHTTSMNKKLVEYWEIMDSSSIVSAVLNPCTRLKIFNNITEQENAINLTHQAFNLYKSQLKPSVPCNNMNSDKPELYTIRQFFWQLGSQDHQLPITRESTNIQN